MPPPIESTSSLRKPRTTNSGRLSPANTAGPSSRSTTPVSASSNLGGSSNPYANSQKTTNEEFFAGLGQANELRPANLPPSQGGRYGGFGSSASSSQPNSEESNQFNHPSTAFSSRALPSLNDLQNNPMGAISKGWGFFSSTVTQATKTINESVIQPGLSKAADPDLQNQLYGIVSNATKVVGEGARRGGGMLGDGLRAGSDYAKQQGFDVGDLGAGYVDKVAGAPSGYSAVEGGSHFGSNGGYSDGAGGNGYGSQESGNAYQGYDATGGNYGDAHSPQPQTFSYNAQQNEGDFFSDHLNPSSSSAPTSGKSTPALLEAEAGISGMSLGQGGGVGAKKIGLGASKRSRGGAQKLKSKSKDIDEDWGAFD